MVGLKRDLLTAGREEGSRQHGDETAASFDGAEYYELSAKTRQGLREFWFSIIRKLRDQRVELWREEVGAYQRRKEEAEKKRKESWGRAYRNLTGESSDRGM